MPIATGDDYQKPMDRNDTVMLPNISQAELTLLECLHERSGGSGERIWLNPRLVSRSLRISVKQLAETSESLAAHGLAGVRGFRPNEDDVPRLECAAIWITKAGKDYLRQWLTGPCQARMSTRL